MGIDKKWCPSGFDSWSLVFSFLYEWPTKIITKNNSIVLFADDTSLLITDSNKLDINTNINQSLHNIISWFNINLLVLYFNKTHYVEFRTKNYYEIKTKVTYDHINISNSTETKFLGLIIDETLSWNQHVDQIATKLCSACYALRNLKHIIPQSTLQTIYYAYIHSILSYGIIFWGRSLNFSKLFILQKRIIRNINNTVVRESCKKKIKNMEIMTYSQYIFSLILFAVKNKYLFTLNNEIHTYKTRNYLNFHLPTVNLTKFY
jgi:hypothetical protein